MQKTDPAVHFIMRLTRDYNAPALKCVAIDAGLNEDTIRQWFYRVPNSKQGPHIGVVRRALNALGYDLAIVPLTDRRDQDEV